MIWRWLILAGIALLGAGGIILLLGRLPGIDKLPGNILIDLAGFTCVFPLLLSIVLSIVLTLILNLISRWFR